MEVPSIFDKSDANVLEIYQELLNKTKNLQYETEEKKSSLHFSNGRAFLGLKPAKKWLDLTIVSETKMNHPLNKKSEQVSKNRWHNDFRLEETQDVDANLINFILESYNLK